MKERPSLLTTTDIVLGCVGAMSGCLGIFAKRFLALLGKFKPSCL